MLGGNHYSDPAPTAAAPLTVPKIEPGTEPASASASQNPAVSLISGFTPAPSFPPAVTASPSQQLRSELMPRARLDVSLQLQPTFGSQDMPQSSRQLWPEFEQKVRPESVSALNSQSGAMVPMPAPDPLPEDGAAGEVTPRRPKNVRSSELVRIVNMDGGAERQFRESVKKTRILYDSLRIFLALEEDDRQRMGLGRRFRVDSKAATMMRDSFQWLNRDKRIVGKIPGIQIGDIFFFRLELCILGLHGHTQAGIDYLGITQSSNGEPIATSIIVSGGYEDDDDQGDVIIYTGHGGQDKLGRQADHQKLEGGNLAMERSMYYGLEVRVIRGFRYENSISSRVYVYDGLFRVVECWLDVGKSGFGVYKYRLERIEGQPQMGSSIISFAKMLVTNPVALRPKGYLSFDMSERRETTPVLLYNDIDEDREPLCYQYLPKTVFPSFIYSGSNRSGCGCVSSCGNDCLCAAKNGGSFPYDYHGNLVREKPMIFECGVFCQCPPNCRNRVTQRGLSTRLEVFRSRETGWGVRSLEIIHSGAFICEFSGIALTSNQADILSMNGDMSLSPGQFKRDHGWGDLSAVGYGQRIYPATPQLGYAIDVSKGRNAACYISHSADPNVMVQLVLSDHNNVKFPRVMLFALETIPPMTELSLDYGVSSEPLDQKAICN